MSIGYLLKESISGFQRTKVATVGSMLTITVALLLMSLFGLLWTNTARIADLVRDRIELEAFLEEPLGAAKRGTIERAILADPGVRAVEFISKERAAEIFMEEFGEDVRTVLKFNPLPPSYRISLRDEYRNVGLADSAQARIAAITGIESVAYRRDLLEIIDSQAESLRIIGLALGILITFSAVFLVANTIRLAISAKWKIIQTMKLVGASRLFVRAPFVMEGCIQGVLGAAFAGLVMHYLFTWLGSVLTGELAAFIAVDAAFYAFVMAGGLLLGLIGSLISVRKFIGESITV
jgi:cell division transport system permease protein